MKRTNLLGLALAMLSPLAACGPSEAEGAGGPAVIGAAADDDPRLRRVWADAGDYSTPSPDGRSVAFVDWSTGDVAVHDIAAGESRRITDKGTWTENGSWAEWPIFSPDGTRVAYSYGNTLTGEPFRYEIRYVELGDTTQHLLKAVRVEDDWVVPLDWAEPGILFAHYTTPDESLLGLLDPATGEERILDAEFGRARGPGREARFSPDGRYVAYEKQGLKILDLTTGTIAAISFPTTALVDWAVDGRGLLVHSVQDNRAGFWLVPVTDGRQAGAPRPIRGGIPTMLQGGKRGAGDSFYYSIPADAPRVHIASVDVKGGRLLTAPVSLTTSLDGRAHVPTWSPEGTQLAYLLTPLNNQGPARLMIREVDGDGLRELAALKVPRIEALRWTADGSEVLLLGRNGEIHSVSVQDGAVRQVTRVEGSFATLSHDGRRAVSLLIHPDRTKDQADLVITDLASGERQVLERFTDVRARGFSFSPDDRSLAYVMRTDAGSRAPTQLRTISLRGGASTIVATLEFPRHLEFGEGVLAWSSDGRHILAGVGEWGKMDSHDLVAFAVADGAMRPLEVPGFPGTNRPVSLSSGSDRIAYVAGEGRNELWILDRIDR